MHYAQSIFTAWVDLGLVGFIYLTALIILPTAAMLMTGYFATDDSGDFILAFAMACATILLLIKSHYFTDMLIGASIGAYSKYKYFEKYAKLRSRAAVSTASRGPSPVHPSRS